jgi:hypothetical protein
MFTALNIPNITFPAGDYGAFIFVGKWKYAYRCSLTSKKKNVKQNWSGVMVH